MAKESELETKKVERKDVDSVMESKVSLPVGNERPTPTYKVTPLTISSLRFDPSVYFFCTR